MIYFNFNSYEEFKKLFGKRTANNGQVIRQNSILLAFLKNEFKRKNFRTLSVANSMTDLYNYIMCRLDETDNNVSLKTERGTLRTVSPDYHTDGRFGVCEDYDTKSIRYVRNDSRKVYKMKAGKFMRHLLMSNPNTSGFCEQAINYVCETFASEWRAYRESESPESYELVVNDDFATIYDSEYLKGDFGSCMTDEGYHTFYNDAVDASAASLWKDGSIVARCVIFNKVYVKGKDKTLRLAERQYSSEGDDALKRILVNRLIAEGYIDGYKKVGAGCHDSRAFVLNDGTSLEEEHLSIRCDLDFGEPLSYQDSFKYYDCFCRIAWNRAGDFNYALDTTDGCIEGEWDSWHEEFVRTTNTVYVWNWRGGFYNEETCDADRMDDFTEIDGEFYDEVNYSQHYDCYYPLDKSTWCEEMEDYLPDDEYEEILEEWKSYNWKWDEYNEKLVEETVPVHVWNDGKGMYEYMSVEKKYAMEYFYFMDGEYYSEVSEDGTPYKSVLCEAV